MYSFDTVCHYSVIFSMHGLALIQTFNERISELQFVAAILVNKLDCLITSAKEVMFLPDFVCLSVCLFVCLCVSKITQKVMDGFF